jgi:hypothetical protein
VAKKKRRTIKSRKESISARKPKTTVGSLIKESQRLTKSFKESVIIGAALAGPGKFIQAGKIFKRGKAAKKASDSVPSRKPGKFVLSEKEKQILKRADATGKPPPPLKLKKLRKKAVVVRSAKSIKERPLTATITDVGSGKVTHVGPGGLTKAQKATIKRERGETFRPSTRKAKSKATFK